MAEKVWYLVTLSHDMWSLYTIIAYWQIRKQFLMDLQLDHNPLLKPSHL